MIVFVSNLVYVNGVDYTKTKPVGCTGLYVEYLDGEDVTTISSKGDKDKEPFENVKQYFIDLGDKEVIGQFYKRQEIVAATAGDMAVYEKFSAYFDSIAEDLSETPTPEKNLIKGKTPMKLPDALAAIRSSINVVAKSIPGLKFIYKHHMFGEPAQAQPTQQDVTGQPQPQVVTESVNQELVATTIDTIPVPTAPVNIQATPLTKPQPVQIQKQSPVPTIIKEYTDKSGIKTRVVQDGADIYVEQYIFARSSEKEFANVLEDYAVIEYNGKDIDGGSTGTEFPDTFTKIESCKQFSFSNIATTLMNMLLTNKSADNDKKLYYKRKWVRLDE